MSSDDARLPERPPTEAWSAPPALLRLPPGELHVWRVPVAEAAGDAAILAGDERARADRFLREEDRRRFVAARAALRRLVAGYLGGTPAAVRLAAGAHGKPTLEGAATLRFNASHSGGLVLLAFARDREVGVDVEEHRPLADVDALAETACTARELEGLAALAPAARPAALLDLWTAKEAGLKALGQGLLVPPLRVELAPVPWCGASAVTVGGDGEGRTAFEVRRLPVGPGRSGAVAHAAGDALLVLYEYGGGAA